MIRLLINYYFGLFVYNIVNFVDWRYLPGLSRVAVYIEKLRSFCLVSMGANLAKNSYVRCRSFIINPKNLTMGANSKIGINSQLYLYDQLVIGDNVEIGSNLVVHTAEHIFNDPSRPLCKQGALYKSVKIGSNVYIGSNVTILAGIVIGENIVIGAGSVVTKNLESGYIYAGIPAKKVKPLVQI